MLLVRFKTKDQALRFLFNIRFYQALILSEEKDFLRGFVALCERAWIVRQEKNHFSVPLWLKRAKRTGAR